MIVVVRILLKGKEHQSLCVRSQVRKKGKLTIESKERKKGKPIAELFASDQQTIKLREVVLHVLPLMKLTLIRYFKVGGNTNDILYHETCS